MDAQLPEETQPDLRQILEQARTGTEGVAACLKVPMMEVLTAQSLKQVICQEVRHQVDRAFQELDRPPLLEASEAEQYEAKFAQATAKVKTSQSRRVPVLADFTCGYTVQ